MEILKRQLNTGQTQKNFKEVAWFYNIWSRLTESKAAKKVIEFADIKNGDQVIEIACGTGVLLKEIVKRNPNGYNLGIDLSKEMLSKAKKLLTSEPEQSYELIQGDVFKLNIRDQTYDKLINNFMIDLMPEDKFDFIISEFYRILRPNGIAVIAIFSFGKKRINKFWIWLARHYPKILTDCRPVDITKNLEHMGFSIEKELEISQNTFPSKIYKVRKKYN